MSGESFHCAKQTEPGDEPDVPRGLSFFYPDVQPVVNVLQTTSPETGNRPLR